MKKKISQFFHQGLWLGGGGGGGGGVEGGVVANWTITFRRDANLDTQIFSGISHLILN